MSEKKSKKKDKGAEKPAEGGRDGVRLSATRARWPASGACAAGAG